MIHDPAIDKRKSDEAVQPGAGLRKGRTTASIDVASTEHVTKEWDQIDFLQNTRLSGAHVGGKEFFRPTPGAALTSNPVKVVRDIPAKEFQERLFPPTRVNAATDHVRKVLATSVSTGSHRPTARSTSTQTYPI